MAGSVREALRTGSWARFEPTPVRVLATGAVVADGTTTALFLAGDLATEQNGIVRAGVEHGLVGGIAAFLVTQAPLLLVAWLALGPVSTYVGSYLVVTMGFGGGVNNAVLIVTGRSLLAPLGSSLSYLAPPVAATAVGFVVVHVTTRDPPWLEVGLVAALLLVGEVGSVLL